MNEAAIASNVKTIFILITTIMCIVHASWWSRRTLVNFCIKMSFIFIAIWGVLLVIYDLGLLNFTVTVVSQ